MIIRNSIKTPDGTELVSNKRHDYKEYIDKNGKLYFIDGGNFYLRHSCNNDEINTSVHTSDDFEVVREVFKWGTYGKDGKSDLKWKKLKDLDTDHITAILETQFQVPEDYRDIFKKELQYRLQN